MIILSGFSLQDVSLGNFKFSSCLRCWCWTDGGGCFFKSAADNVFIISLSGFVCLSVCISNCLSPFLFFCLSLWGFVFVFLLLSFDDNVFFLFLSLSEFFCLSVCLCKFVSLSVSPRLSLCLSLQDCLSVFLLRLSFCQYVSLCVFRQQCFFICF
jgi:hypothetical protein